MSHVQQAAHGFASIRAIVQGALVDVHADKLVGELGIDIARELHGVGQGFVAMVERVLNAVPQGPGYFRGQLRSQTALYRVATQGSGNPVTLSHHLPRSTMRCRPALA